MRRYDKKQNILEANSRLENEFVVDKTSVDIYITEVYNVINDNIIGSFVLPDFWGSCLTSESFTNLEKESLTILFEGVGINLLSESTLREGFGTELMSSVKNVNNWLVGKGKEGVDALKRGLSKIGDFFKKIKEKLKELFDNMVKMFSLIWSKSKESFNTIKGKIVEFIKKEFQVIRDSKDNHMLGKDVKSLGECSKHIVSKFGGYIGSISDKAFGESFKLEKELSTKIETPTNESYNRVMIGESFSSDIINETLNGGLLLEGKQDSTLMKWVKKILKGLQWIFNPIGKLIEEIIKMISRHMFKIVSLFSSMLKGPGPFEFTALAGVTVGLTALIMDVGQFGLPEWATWTWHLLTVVIPALANLEDALHGLHTLVIGALAGEVIVELYQTIDWGILGGKQKYATDDLPYKNPQFE
tara:strand:+ start:1008 stop:2252 length:1245 start_codon:yes stop_codon:yes gene_type:complete